MPTSSSALSQTLPLRTWTPAELTIEAERFSGQARRQLHEAAKAAQWLLGESAATGLTLESGIALSVAGKDKVHVSASATFAKAAEAGLVPVEGVKLVGTWCGCPIDPEATGGADIFVDDGECSCPNHHHHYHCPRCGGITQTG